MSLLLKKFLMQLFINLIGNAFFLIFLLNDILLDEIFRNSKQLKNVRINKLKIKPTSELQLFIFEYTPLNVDLRYTHILQQLLVPVIKTSKKGI